MPGSRRDGRLRFATRGPLIATLLLAALLGPVAPSSAGKTTCNYDADSGIVTLVPGVGDQVQIERDGNKIVELGSDCGNATRFNTTKIVINDPPDTSSQVFLSLDNGLLKPGRQNEAGNSDEIEIEFHSGNGDFDVFQLKGTDEPDFIATGIHFTGNFSYETRMNLNSNESNGVDHDVTLEPGLDYLNVLGEKGDDRLTANGGYGTDSVILSTIALFGEQGADWIIGGAVADLLNGGAHTDVIKGGNGDDEITGAKGDDTLKGQERDDILRGHEGDDFMDGGPGDDFCRGGQGVNTTTRCEDIT